MLKAELGATRAWLWCPVSSITYSFTHSLTKFALLCLVLGVGGSTRQTSPPHSPRGQGREERIRQKVPETMGEQRPGEGV